MSTIPPCSSVERVTQATVGVDAGFSVGYIIWLLRSGVVHGSMLAALPAWCSIDLLPVLGSFEKADDTDDEESLETIVDEARTEKR